MTSNKIIFDKEYQELIEQYGDDDEFFRFPMPICEQSMRYICQQIDRELRFIENPKYHQDLTYNLIKEKFEKGELTDFNQIGQYMEQKENQIKAGHKKKIINDNFDQLDDEHQEDGGDDGEAS